MTGLVRMLGVRARPKLVVVLVLGSKGHHYIIGLNSRHSPSLFRMKVE